MSLKKYGLFVLMVGVLQTAVVAQFTSVQSLPETAEELSTYRTPKYLLETDDWADKQLNSMSLRQRIGQLFMVAAYSNKTAAHEAEIKKLISTYHIGGLIFFQGGPVRQTRLLNAYQELAKVPLLIGMDAEWGVSMRLDSTLVYPRQMTLGAVQNDQLIYEMGEDIAAQCKRLGVHINFAPVVDVNNNPKNPVINSRSFGENQHKVAKKGLAYAKGMEAHRVMACAKHFPGHGNTTSDSHYSLPTVPSSKEELDSIELTPFRTLIDAGVSSLMVAHLNVPALDSNKGASTLSKKIVTTLLRDSLGFKGLAFTDALNMKGVASYVEPGELDKRAIIAGNDVLLFPEDVPKAVDAIELAVKNGEISASDIDQKVLSILKAKQWVGLDKWKAIPEAGVVDDLNTEDMEFRLARLYEHAITLARNKDSILPIRDVADQKIAALSIGSTSRTVFQNTLGKYADVSYFNVSKTPSFKEIIALHEKLAAYDVIIIGLHNTSLYARNNFRVTKEMVNLVDLVESKSKVILTHFGNPYALKMFEPLTEFEGLVLGYEDNKYAQDYAAQAIFGGISFLGKVPVTVSEHLREGQGVYTANLQRLKYTRPEELGIRSEWLAQADAIAMDGIEKGAYPGCQVLMAKDGKVFYQKSFGFHTYDKKLPVKNDDLYDLASITKIGASVISLMKLIDEGKVDLDYSLCDYIPALVDSTPYKDIVLREMLAHQAGLKAWIPFYQKTLVNGTPRYDFYSLVPSEEYPFQVAEKLYMHKDMPDKIMQIILNTPLNKEQGYKYSDLGYYFIQRIVENISGQSLADYAMDNFYKPIGATTLGYRPVERFTLERIPPTEDDRMFRKQLIQGYVHDPGAAMMGGVGGHAGLFSSANDLAKLMQLFLNWGSYGGTSYINPETVKEFSKCQYCEEDNRRGAGFDKPVRDGSSGPTCNCISFESFGHSGFTGTLSWVDPEEKVVYIFLSNRVYPDATNTKLQMMDIRTDIMEVLFNAIQQAKDTADS